MQVLVILIINDYSAEQFIFILNVNIIDLGTMYAQSKEFGIKNDKKFNGFNDGVVR